MVDSGGERDLLTDSGFCLELFTYRGRPTAFTYFKGTTEHRSVHTNPFGNM